MINRGTNYSKYEVVINANTSHGSSATANGAIAPYGGHGSDAVKELGGYNVMLSVKIDGDETGTLFTNNADEFRFELTHEHVAGFEGVWGFQYSTRDFSAIGEEAFILPSKTNIYSAFLIEEREFDNWHGEFGLRFDDQSIITHSHIKLIDVDQADLMWGDKFLIKNG